LLFEDDDDDDDERSGERTTPVVTMGKVLTLSADFSGFKESLAPFLGERVCTKKLAVCRGEDDLPDDWDRLFDEYDDDDDTDTSSGWSTCSDDSFDDGEHYLP